MGEFKKGDKLRCINSADTYGYLKAGTIYTFVKYDVENAVLEEFLQLPYDVGSFSPKRFELVEEAPSKEKPVFNQEEFHTHVRRLFVKPSDHFGRVLHAAVGNSGEAGEVIDIIKKVWITNSELNLDKLMEELGDQLFYMVALLNQYGKTLGDVAEINYKKLAKRYPNGYNDEDARARADVK